MSQQQKCCIRRRFLYSKFTKVSKTCSIRAWAHKDLISLDFLWGPVKTIVYASKPNSLEDLKVKIINVISGITVNQSANVFRELQNRITLCIANDK